MSKNISVKINSGNETVETVKLNATNKKVIIKAQPNVNYELVDDNTQYAPETIDTKRIGNDLHIAFEGTDINQESDLVLEGYYENNNTELLLGKAENGRYYAYVPQSGVESDAVTLLAEQVFAPQALGGNSVATPFWAFNPNWLWAAAGVAAVGGIIAAASGGKGSSNPDTTAPAKPTVEAKDNGSVEVTPPADADTKSVEVSYTDEAGTLKTATLIKSNDGNWTSNNPDVAVDPATGKATIPADKVKDGSPVTAKATDTAGNAGEEGTANAGNNPATPDTTAPSAPEVTPSSTDGSVKVKVPSDAEAGDTVEVTVTPEGSDTPEKVTLTKQPDGSWTSDKPETVPGVEAGKDSTTIPQDKVKDGSEVTAQAKDPSGNESTPVKANAGNNAAAPDTTAPSAPEVTPSTTDGSVTVKVPGDAQAGDTVEVTVTPEGSDTPEKVTLTKQPDGSWTSDKPETVPGVEAGKDSTTIPQDKVKDGSEVTAQAKDPSGNESTPVKANAGNNAAAPDTTAPSAPEVTPSTTDGSVTVKVPGDAQAGDTVEVTVTPEGSDTPEKVTLTKQPDGSWTSDKPETVPNVEAGKDSTTIPQDKVKDGSEVTAQAKDPSGNESTPVKANAGNNAAAPDTTAPAKPTVEAKDNGSVEVTPPADADTKSVEVSYTDEAGTPKTATLTKGEDGTWTSNNPDVAVDPATGKATIPADKVKDGSPVTAKATDTAGNAGEEGTANAGNNPDTTAPSAPEVTPSTTDGSVAVKVPGDAQAGDTVEVTVTPEGSDTPEKVTLTKQADGSWTSDKPETVPSVEAGKDSTTIPQDKVKDGSEVTAQAKDPSGNESTPVKANAGNNAATPDTTAPAKPTVEAKDNGSVEVTPPADADTKSVEVSYTDEAGTPKTATLTKGNDGNWTSSNPDVAVDPATGKATIPADKVKDGSPVTAKATDTAGNTGEEGTANAGNNPDTTAPSAPEVTPSSTDGSVKVKVPSDAEAGDTVEVTVTPEGSDTPEKVTLTKQPDGSWTSDKPETVPGVEAGKDSTTIPEDKVKDGSEVSAKAKDPSGNESTPVKANAGNNAATPDTTAPSAPEVTPSSTDGSVKVKVPSDAEAGDTVEVTVTPEGSDTPEKVTLTKQPDGSWTSDKPETVPGVEAGKDSTTIPEDKVKDGSEVSAKAKDPSGNESTPVKANAGNNAATPDTTAPSAPEVTPSSTDGSVKVKVPSDAEAGDTVEVTVTPEGSDTPEKVTLTKQPDGSWTSDKPETVPGVEAGKDSTTIPEDKVKDGSEVSAKAKDPSGNESTPVKANAGNNAATPDTTAPSAPEVTPSSTDGSVKVKVPSDAEAGDTVEVTVTPEGSDTPEKVTLTKQPDGSWTSDKPETVPGVEAGKDSTTIPQDKVKDGSEVTAQAKDPSGNESTPVKANAGNNAAAPDTTAPSAPEVTPSTTDGSVTVKVPGDAQAGDTVEVTVTPEGSDTPEKVTLTKNADGSWTSDKPETVPSVEAGKDSTTIPQDKVKDGSEVSAQAKDPSGNESTPVKANAGNNAATPDTTAPAQPTVTAKDNGSVEVTPPADADTKSVEVSYTDEAGTPKTATLTKGEDGNWTSNNPDVAVDPATGKATIPADKVKDGSPVTAKATDTAGNAGEEGTANAGNNPDTTAPSAPEVTPSTTDGSVTVKVPGDAQAGDTVEVTVTPEGSDTPEKVTLTKNADGSWTSDKPETVPSVEAGKDSTTIPQDKVKDGSEVSAQAKDPSGNESTPVKANAGNNAATPDTTAPAQPTVTAKDNGSVEVTPPADADTKSVEVSYTDEAGTPKTATLTKGEDGTWTSNNPDVAVDPATGKATIPADKVKDGSPVTAKATDTAGNVGEEGTANAGNNPDTTAPAKPTVEAKDNGSVEVTPPADADTKSVEVSYTDEAGTPKTATLTKGEDGTWTSNNPDVAVDPATGKATIPADKVKDGSPVTAKATDTAGNAGEEGTANAGNNPDTTAPSAPEIALLVNGSANVVVYTAEVGDMLKISLYFPETGNWTQVATLTKQEDGSWISDKPENVSNIEAGSNVANVLRTVTKGASVIAAHTEDPAGNSSPEALKDFIPDLMLIAPKVIPSTTDGAVTIVPTEFTEPGDTVEIQVIPEGSDTPEKVTLTKNADSSWTSDKPEIVPSIEVGQDRTTIPQDKVKDGSDVTVQAKDPVGRQSNLGYGRAGNNVDKTAPSAPEVTPSTTDGSVTVKVPGDAQAGDTVEVTVTPEGSDTPEKVTLTKQADGSWTSDKPETVPSVEAGKDSTTIPQDKVKDGSEVSAKAKDPAGNESTPAKANAGNNAATPDTTAPAKPTVEAKDNGSVEVTPPADADTKSVEVSYTDEAGTPKTATLTKGEDGTWTSNNPDVAVDPATGKATIPADKVKDGSPVTAKATDTAGNAGEEGTANAGNNPDTTAPAQPTVTAKDNGSVEVTPPADADTKSVEVSYTDEAGTPKTATLTKGEDGNWTSNNPDVAVDPATGKATIPADKVKDGSPVTAKATDTAGNASEEGTANAGNNPDTTAPAKPTVEAKDNGSVEVTPPADADTKSVEVSYTDEAGTPKTATLTKGEDGNWTSNNPDVAVDPATGKATIPADKVKDGSPVTAKATDTAGNAGEEGTANAGNNPDTTAPAKPTVEAKDNGSVEVTPPADADTKSVEVSYTDEAGTPKTATLTKGEDGNWTSNNPDVAVDPATGKATIPADKVQDGSPVKAKATDTAGNAGEEGTVNAGNNPDTTAPSAPEVTPSTTDGSVTVKVPGDAQAGDTVEVTVTTEGSDTPEKVTLTKQADGSWTSDKPETVPSVEAGKDSTTIPQDKVKDGSEVTAQAKDPSGNDSVPVTAQAGENADKTAPGKPTIEAKINGTVEITPPADEDTKSVEVNYIDEEGNPQTVTIIKDANEGWIPSEPFDLLTNPDVILPDPETGKITLPADKVKDGSLVKASATDNAGNKGEEATENAVSNPDTRIPDTPVITPFKDGSATVQVPNNTEAGDVLEIKLYDASSATITTVTLTKNADSSWTSDKPEILTNIEAGKDITTKPADKLKNAVSASAEITTPSGNGSPANLVYLFTDNTAPAKPTVEAKDNGSVEVTPPADEDTKSVEVSYTDEAGTPKTATITKGADGAWTSNNPDVAVDPATGKATIPADKVQDGSPVKAKATDNAGNIGNEGTANAGNNPDTTAPSAPEVTPSTEDGSVTVKVPSDAEAGDTVEVTVTPEGSDTPEKVTLTKQTDGSWTSSNPTTLPNVEAGQSSTTIPQDKVKDGSHVTAQAKDPAGNESAVVSQPAGNNKVVKLELSLAQDTGASNHDNYTRNGQVNVSGIPSGSEWEYSTDGGQHWTSGSGNSFTLPNNTKVGGIAYSLQARVKGNAASTSDTLNMTLDQKAGEFHAIIDGSMNLIGTAEKNSTISINNRSGKADANGEFEFATGIASGATAKKVHYSVVETDLAGNSVSKDVAYTYYRRFAGGSNETYGNENDVILIGTKGGTGDLGALIRSSLTTGNGDDSVYATGVQYGSNTLDMGNGNDFASFKNIGGTINMGAGNDILEGRNTDNPFFYLSQHARVDMGTGDDIVRTANTLNTRASIDGGDGFDTLQFINNNGKAFSSTLTMISHFEKIDITGTLNNSVTISASDVERNHSAKATVDASGKSHNNVLIVDGDAGDKVTLSGISKAASSKVTYEGNTYNVYNTGSNELWVDSDITVA